jgi:hypothetical protein
MGLDSGVVLLVQSLAALGRYYLIDVLMGGYVSVGCKCVSCLVVLGDIGRCVVIS